MITIKSKMKVIVVREKYSDKHRLYAEMEK